MANGNKNQILDSEMLKAIEAYKKWESQHPKAPRRKKYRKFNEFCDSAELNKLLNANS